MESLRPEIFGGSSSVTHSSVKTLPGIVGNFSMPAIHLLNMPFIRPIRPVVGPAVFFARGGRISGGSGGWRWQLAVAVCSRQLQSAVGERSSNFNLTLSSWKDLFDSLRQALVLGAFVENAE